MVSGRMWRADVSKHRLAIPHYLISLPSGTYVIDAYFIKNISVIPRRSLLIYPKSVITGLTYSESSITVLDSNLGVYEVYSMIKETYERVKEAVFKDIKRILHRSRLWVFMPVPRQLLGDIDRESRNALIILEKVFENCSLSAEADIISWDKAYVTIDVKYKKKDMSIDVKAPKPIPRIYSWLYEVDEGFRRAMNKVLNVE